MKQAIFNIIVFSISSVLAFFPAITQSKEQTDKMDIYAGYFAREGNNDTPTLINKHNIYMKLFKEGQWVVTLHIPHADGPDAKPDAITKALEEAKRQATTTAYIKGKFGHLKKRSIATIERYGYVEKDLMFECNSLAPCRIKLKEDYFELVKPGMLNDHIIRYNHIISDETGEDGQG